MMNKKSKIKLTYILVLFILLCFSIASTVIIIEYNHKQTESETIYEPVAPSVPETDPNQDTASDIEEDEYVYPHQVHYIAGWDKCLDQLNIDCDIALLGDSITYKSSFEVEFPEFKICNLSVCSETIKGINYRVGTLETVKPEKVFLMIGINSLRNHNFDVCIEDYRALVENIKSKGNFELYLISVTPIAKNEAGEDNPSPDIIVSFNKKIAELADEYGATYMDLYSHLVDSGYIKPEYTSDGLHLSDDAYDVWADCMKPYLE